MKYRAFALLAGTSLFTLGCPNFVNANGPVFTPASVPEGKAVVYFYRPAQKLMSDYPFFMSIPESANNCYRLESGGYTAHVADPGKLVVAGVMTSYKTVSLDLKAGDKRYVQVDISDDDAAPKEVSAAEAEAQIAAMHGIETCSPDEVKKE